MNVAIRTASPDTTSYPVDALDQIEAMIDDGDSSRAVR